MSNDTYSWKSQAFWLRVLYMIIISFLAYFALVTTWVLLFVQLVVTLLSGTPNAQIGRFGGSLGVFVSQAIAFLTFSTEDKPFPFSDWPAIESKD